MEALLNNPQAMMWGLVTLAAFAVLALAGAVWSITGRHDASYHRLMALAGQERPTQPLGLGARLRGMLGNLATSLADLVRPKQSWQVSRLQKQLVVAGYRHPGAVNIFLAIKAITTLAFPLLLLVSPLMDRFKGSMAIVVLAVAAAIGFILPGYIITLKTRKRQTAITRELPDVLDLLAITVEAGLGLDAAIARVAKEVRVSSPILSGEMNLASLELRAGIPRDQALRNLANRCGVDEVSSLVAMLNQADRFGVSVGRSLRVHSDSVRTKRRQRMEELAAKIPLKLLFPVLFLIFPAIMVVMAGPAIIRVSETMFTK